MLRTALLLCLGSQLFQHIQRREPRLLELDLLLHVELLCIKIPADTVLESLRGARELNTLYQRCRETCARSGNQMGVLLHADGDNIIMRDDVGMLHALARNCNTHNQSRL